MTTPKDTADQPCNAFEASDYENTLCSRCGHLQREHGLASCLWHRREKPIQENDSTGCCGCGAMYVTRDCENCGKTFLDWNARGYDDVVAGPYVTCSGDLYCTRCGPRRDRAEEEREADEFFEEGDHL